MQTHWTEVAPPTYITSAHAAGFKPKEGGGDEMIEDPDQLALALSTMPGGQFL